MLVSTTWTLRNWILLLISLTLLKPLIPSIYRISTSRNTLITWWVFVIVPALMGYSIMMSVHPRRWLVCPGDTKTRGAASLLSRGGKRPCYRGYSKFSLLSGGIIGWAWVRPTLVCSMSSFVCMQYIIRGMLGRLSWSLVSCTYCHHIHPLSCPSLSPSLNKSVQQHDHTCQWRKRERTATETQDHKATTLYYLCIATSLTLTPQCSAFML